MPAAGWITIGAATLSTVIRNEQIGDLPLLLRPDPIWSSGDEQRQVDAVVQAELGQLGWVDRNGRLDVEVLDDLQLLARPPVEYGAFFELDGLQHRVIVAGTADSAVIARRNGASIQLSFVRDELLAESLLRQLPVVPPAPMPAINLRTSASPATSMLTSDVRPLHRLRQQQLRGVGELYVAVRDWYGRHSVSAPISYQDYAIGRVLVVVFDGYLTIAPASSRLLLARLREAQAAVAAWT